MKKVLALVSLLGLGILSLGSTHSQAPLEFRRIKLSNLNERVTGIHCTGIKSCLIATDRSSGGRILLSDGQGITNTLVTGDDQFAQSVGTLGTIGFMGFSKLPDRLVVMMNGSSSHLLSASNDPTQASSWGSKKIGSSERDAFGLNQQMGIGVKDDRWAYFIQSNVLESSDPPGPGALWTPIWSPVSPSIPSNWFELRRANPKLCDNEPGVPFSPKLTQPAYVAPDLAVILYPSGARNQGGKDPAGVCISTDGGKRFERVEFKGVESGLGPLGVTCISSNRCFAYGGLDYNPGSSFIYVSNDAQKGAASTWVLAKLPTLREDTKFRHVFFAPDGTNGWAVGSVGSNSPLLLSTTDGGASWKDSSSLVRAALPETRLHSGFASDANHVWLGGEFDTLLAAGN